jgi:DNA-directed RNA polymerase alpha subunit
MELTIEDLLNGNELHMEQLLKAPLADLDIEAHTLRILKGKGIETLRDLTALSRKELLRIKFLGERNVDELERLLERIDLKLKA